MAHCIIKTPDENINHAFSRLDKFLSTYKIGPETQDVWAPGVLGYGIDEVTPRCQDTRDNRWMSWAARYCEPDDAFLSQMIPSILREAFDAEGRERHEVAAPAADDYLHYYVWWLLQIALGYLYSGDTSLDLSRIWKIVETTYALFDPEHVGMPHTSSQYFVTSIGEPFNTDPGKAYGFFQCCNLAFSLRQFAGLSEAKGQSACKKYFEEKLEFLLQDIQTFRSPEGFYHALKDKSTGTFRYRVTGPDDLCLMTDNVFFPLAFNVISSRDLQPSLDYLLPWIREQFPVPYAHPAYRGEGAMAWWIPRSWQECLVHYCLGLRELEMPAPVHIAIKRQADSIAQDNEVWEHYDPATGEGEGSRRGYSTTSACLNIAIIECLFGIRPQTPGFDAISIKPAFPESWPSAAIDMEVSEQRIAYTMTATAAQLVYDFAKSANIWAELVLPLPADWQKGEVRASVSGTFRFLRSEHRQCFVTSLPLSSLRVELRRMI